MSSVLRILLFLTIAGPLCLPGKALGASELLSPPEDLHATNWILARASTADTINTAPIVHLASLNTIVSDLPQEFEQTTRTVTRMQRQEAADSVRLSIPFTTSEGIPTVLLARIIQADGTVRDLQAENRIVAAATGSDSTLRELFIPTPGLTVGSIIDLAFTKTVKPSMGAPWSWLMLFQEEAPTLETTLVLRVRNNLPVRFRSGGGAPSPVVLHEPNVTITRWSVGSAPAQTEAMTDWSEQIPWVAATLAESWPASSDPYRKSFWNQIRKTEEIQELARRCTRGARTRSQKLECLFRYVSQNVRDMDPGSVHGTILPDPPKRILRRGSANSWGKAALLIALCEAAGIEAWPVFVQAPGSPNFRDDFVSLELLHKAIVYVPDRRGGTFCDPTGGSLYAGDLPAAVAGTSGLTFGRSAPGRLIAIPPADFKQHGLSIEMDVRPVGNSNEARFEVVARLRGEVARAVRPSLDSKDSTIVGNAVDRILGYGLPSTCLRERWALVEGDPRELTLAASYRDSAWAFEAEFTLALRTEVANPVFTFAPWRDRRAPVRVPYPFDDRVVIRLHGSPMWDPAPDVASTSIRGSTYGGTIDGVSRKHDGDQWVEVTQHFELRDPSFTPEGYQAFGVDYSRYIAFVRQPYRFRRHLDTAELERMKARGREHPEDSSFALEAATRILGWDGGGSGPEGVERRAAVRSLLSPHLGKSEVGAAPYLLLAQASMAEGRYRRADSLVTVARWVDPENHVGLELNMRIREQLGDIPALLAAQTDYARATGNKGALLSMITTLYRLGRESEAKQAEERYVALVGSSDPTVLPEARLRGYLKANRCREAWRVFAGMTPDTSISLKALEAGICMSCGSLRRTASIYEEYLEDIVLDWQLSNDVHGEVSHAIAWAYIRLGEKLDRAGDLLVMASVLEPNDVSIRNSKAVLELRLGRVSSARRQLQAALATDDRQNTEVSNGYFLRLCDWVEGDHERALRGWKDLQPRADEEWRGIIGRTIDLAQRGMKPEDAIFGDNDLSLGNGR